MSFLLPILKAERARIVAAFLAQVNALDAAIDHEARSTGGLAGGTTLVATAPPATGAVVAPVPAPSAPTAPVVTAPPATPVAVEPPATPAPAPALPVTAQANAAPAPWENGSAAAAPAAPSGGKRTNEEIAAELGVTIDLVRQWKKSQNHESNRVSKADIEATARAMQAAGAPAPAPAAAPTPAAPVLAPAAPEFQEAPEAPFSPFPTTAYVPDAPAAGQEPAAWTPTFG